METSGLPDRRTGPAAGTRRVLAAAAVAVVLGGGLVLVSRYVAETRWSAIVLGGIWISLAGIAIGLIAMRNAELRRALVGSFVLTVAAITAFGYLTGFREKTVNEDVVIAEVRAPAVQREKALAGNAGEPAGSRQPEPAGPVSLVSGTVVGADGHGGGGQAEIIEDGGSRMLTLTEFDVDPGPAVEVYLTPTTAGVEDRIELGSLKGTQGDQQYGIPADADLRRYDSLVLWCVPFTTRIAIAELR